MNADLIFYNGILLTQDDQVSAQALAVKDGRIIAVGSDDDVLNISATQKYDLGGQTLIPGFNDAHVHVWKVGHLLTTLLDVRGTESIPHLQGQIQDFGASLPHDKWLMGRGYNEAQMAEKRRPTRHDLDAISTDQPIYLIRTCAHIISVNSKALELAGITADTAAPPGGVIERDENGQPNGILHETALGLVFDHIPAPSAAEYEAMLTAATQQQIEYGITSATDPGVMPEILDVYLDMDQHGILKNRLNVMKIRRPDGGTDTLPLPEKYETDFLRVDSIKLFADGGLSGATAALSIPYRNTQGRGVLRLAKQELYELAREAHHANYRLATHAIGDIAIKTVLEVYETLHKESPGQRHRIEHFGLPSKAQMQRAAQLGVIAVPQAIFLHELGPNFRRYIPDPLLPYCYPLRSVLDAGITVALSTDAPVVRESNPLVGLQAAILRQDIDGEVIAAAQKITAKEALYAYTMGGAVASGDADNRGSLTVGKWADFAILDDNPLEVEPAALSEMQVQMTVVGGRIVHQC